MAGSQAGKGRDIGSNRVGPWWSLGMAFLGPEWSAEWSALSGSLTRHVPGRLGESCNAGAMPPSADILSCLAFG